MKKPITIVGVVLVILGVIALIVPHIPFTTEEQVIKVGPVKAEAETKEVVPLPPMVGGVLLVGGIVLVAIGSRNF